MTIVQKWLTGMIGLGALFLVVSQPKGVAAAGSALSGLIGGTEGTILRGGK